MPRVVLELELKFVTLLPKDPFNEWPQMVGLVALDFHATFDSCSGRWKRNEKLRLLSEPSPQLIAGYDYTNVGRRW